VRRRVGPDLKTGVLAFVATVLAILGHGGMIGG
jgi:hypothetical protein